MGWPTLLARDVSISRRPKTGRSVHLPYTRLTRRGASWRPKKTKQKNAAPSTFAACRPPSMGRHHASKPTKRTPPRLSDFPPDWPCLRKVLRWRYRARDTHRSPTGKKKETPMSHQRCDAITVPPCHHTDARTTVPTLLPNSTRTQLLLQPGRARTAPPIQRAADGAVDAGARQ